jgi:ABC-type transport system involved in cytochrome c biogenesis permease subunit
VGGLAAGELASLAVSSAFFVGAFYRPERSRWARLVLFVAWALAVFALARAGVLWRAFPVVTVGGVADLLVVALGPLFLFTRQAAWSVLAGFVVPVLTVVWLVAHLVAGRVPGRIPIDLTGATLAAHVVLATASYAAFVLSAGSALMYLEKERELRRKVPRVFYYRLPALVDSDRKSARWAMAGLALLAAATVCGAVWARATAGTYWIWGAKETATLVTGAVYLAYTGARLAGVGGHRAAWFSLTAFLVVALNFLGLAVLFPGWHAAHGM